MKALRTPPRGKFPQLHDGAENQKRVEVPQPEALYQDTYGKGFTRNQAAEIAEAVTWPHRYNLPRKYRPTYQGYLLNFMLDSALFAAVTIRKG